MGISILLPLVELLFFRWFLHWDSVNVRFRSLGFIDADLVLPGLLAFSFFIYLLDEERSITLKLNHGWAALNGIIVILFILLNIRFHHLMSQTSPPLVLTLWGGTVVMMVLTALLVTQSPRTIFTNPRFLTILPCGVIAASVVIVKHLYEMAWPWFGKVSAVAVCQILKVSAPATRCAWDYSHAYGNPSGAERLLITHPAATLYMGAPCAGIDALILFCSCFVVYALLKKLQGIKAVGIFVVGILYAFCLNLIRVVGILTLSFALNTISPQLKMGLLLGFFHTHAGWLLYGVGLVAFFRFVENWLETTAASSSRSESEIASPT